eukprot:6381737-Prymnesium_polylepis.2
MTSPSPPSRPSPSTPSSRSKRAPRARSLWPGKGGWRRRSCARGSRVARAPWPVNTSQGLIARPAGARAPQLPPRPFLLRALVSPHPLALTLAPPLPRPRSGGVLWPRSGGVLCGSRRAHGA